MSNWERATKEVLPDRRLDITYILTTCGFQFIIEEPTYELCEKQYLISKKKEACIARTACKTSQEERLLKNAGYQLELKNSVVTKL